MAEARRISIFCDCCGREKLAEVVDDGKSLKLSIRDRRHGKIHYFSENLDNLKASCNNPGRSKKADTQENP